MSDDLDLYLKNDFRTHRTVEGGRAGRLSGTRSGTFRVTDAGPDGFETFQSFLEDQSEPRTDILISLQGVWFELGAISGAALELQHLAGALPPKVKLAGTQNNPLIMPSVAATVK